MGRKKKKNRNKKQKHKKKKRKLKRRKGGDPDQRSGYASHGLYRVCLNHTKRGVIMKQENLFEKGLALLKKIDLNALPEGSRALYDRGMAMIQGEDPDAPEEAAAEEETPEEEATEPAVDPGEDTVQPDQPEGEILEVEGGESTADSVMEEKLESETDESVGKNQKSE